MNRRRNLSKIDPQLQRLQVARRLAERLGAMPQEIRYVELWFHDGRQWTRNSYWEHWVDGRWQEVPWTVHNG